MHDLVDVSTMEGRTAAAARAAMIGSEAHKIELALRTARARGHNHEIIHLERRLQALINERARILSALSHSNPLPGMGSFGLDFGASAMAVAAKEQADVSRLDERVRSVEERMSGLRKEIATFEKQLKGAGVAEIGKKSHLKNEIKERQASLRRAENERNELLKKRKGQVAQAKEATALAVQPDKVARELKDKLAVAQSEAERLTKLVRSITKSIEALEKDLKAAPVTALARKNYIKNEIEKKKDQRAKATKDLTKVTAQIKDLSTDLGRAKAYAVASSRVPTAATPTSLPASMAVNERVKISALEKEIAALEKEADELEKGINKGLQSAKDSTALMILLRKRRDLGDSIRAKLFERDEKLKGRLVALNNRLILDRNRVQTMTGRIHQVKASKLSDAAKKTLHAHFMERLKVARENEEGTEKQIKGFFTRRVVKFAPLRTVSPGQLGVVKRQLSLKANAPQPTKDMLAALAALFTKANPPRPGETAEQYLTRIKLYTARGALIAANNVASGQAPTVAVQEAVKDVVVNDAAAIEQEAKAQVSAPAGEEAVATQVKNNEEVIVQAAAAAAPELMQSSMPADAVASAAAAGEQAAAAVTPDPLQAAQAEAAAETAALAPAEASAATTDTAGDEKPWYSKPSGMVLIGIAAIIGYKALASKE